MTENPPFNQAEVEQLRKKMQGAISEAVTNAARRMSGSKEKPMPPDVAEAIRKSKTQRSTDYVIINGVLAGIAQALQPRLAEISRRIAELEAKPTVRYEGVWTAEKVYGRGALVTDGGQVWHCNEANVGVRPPGKQWTLAVKKGRDAR